MTASKSLPLIRAKLYRPPMGPVFVHRPRLSELLDRGLSGPLTLVCAPAGYGKTTLVSAWVETLSTGSSSGAPLPCAWLSLDSRDSNLIPFMRYMIAAIRTLFPDACSETQALLGAPVQPRHALLAASFNNEIAALPTPFILVLDDYSAISDEAIHGLFDELLLHWPQPLRLVLITRRDPPFALAQPRAKGMVTEIRGGDLRFTREEITEYFELSTLTRASQSVVERLDQATEGWVAGLQLTVRSSGVPGPPESEPAPEPGSAFIADYLFDEVLSSQPEPIRAFLLKTAILERHCESLAAAVVGTDEPGCKVRDCMRFIERADLFIASLDDRGEWYRYHHLFRSLLRKQLEAEYSPEQVNRLHERAAGWFGGRGLVDEALHHALAAGNLGLAAETIERGLCEVLNREDPLSLERWLNLLPQEFVSSRPGLLIAKAWVLQFSWQLAAQARLVEQIEALLDSGDEASLTWQGGHDLRSLRGQLILLRAQQAYYGNQPARAMACSEQTLAVLPQSWVYARGGAVLYHALSRWAAGESAGVVESLLDGYESSANLTDSYALRHLLAVCFISVQAGQLEQIRQTAQVMLHQAQRGGSALMHNWARYFLGLVHLERNELASAEQHFAILVAHPYTIFMAALHDSYSGMAMALQAKGDSPAAMQAVETLSALDLERSGQEDARTRSLRARMQLLQGDVEDAGRWADTFATPVPDQPMVWMETPHLTKARILIARNREGDVATALEILDALSVLTRRANSTTHFIRVLALRALALETMGQHEDASVALKQAIELALPGGFVRVFVDLGPQVKALLRRLSSQGFAVETIRRILRAFPGPESGPMSLDPETSVKRSRDGGNGSLVEPLTARELEILVLLQKRLSDKAIARQLFLSTATVQRHAANIYGKLGVHRRTDAVATAEDLGILPPT